MPPIVVNIHAKDLRKRGYADLADWARQPNHVYIGRRNRFVAGATESIWANPFKLTDVDRVSCLYSYEKYMRDRLMREPELRDELKELKRVLGSDGEVGCWCHPQGCHGDVLLKLLLEI